MKRALVSVTDKTNIVSFCQNLVELGWEIISTGGTMKVLEENNIKCISIDEVTSFPEMLDGRVKTLHPKVHGGLLYRRDLQTHVDKINEYDIKPIDLVCVNLYEFEKALALNKPLAEMIENIDIGGPSMIRSAAKNYKDVLVVTDINEYDEVIERLKNDNIDIDYRLKLAYQAFSLTGSYDAVISRYFSDATKEENPKIINISLKQKDTLRYGENSHQKASLYHDSYVQKSLLDYEQLSGKEISFNNVNDLYGAIAVIREFDKYQFVTAAIKHSTPCGVAIGDSPFDSFNKAYVADPLSIFGGIIALNFKVDLKTAEKMNEIFLEIVAAPDFDEDALVELKKKKNLRILKLKNFDVYGSKYDIKYLEGEVLVQDLNKELYEELKVVTKKAPNAKELEDMDFGMRVVKHCKSNAICIVKDGVTLAIGSGQTSRIWALENAIKNNSTKDFTNAVLASDAFFPFNDCAKLAKSVGINAIVQPGGSIKDQDTIDYCDENDMSMTFTGLRHFRH